MATETFDLGGTTETITTDLNNDTIDVIGPGTLDIEANVNASDIMDIKGAVIEVGKNFNASGTFDFTSGVGTAIIQGIPAAYLSQISPLATKSSWARPPSTAALSRTAS